MKPVSVQKVSAILRKAGFTKGGTTVYDWTPGFVVHKRHDGERENIEVGYFTTRRPHNGPEMVAKYQAALEAHGVVCRNEEGTIICTGIKEE